MTNKTLARLMSKRRLTDRERVQLLRAAHDRLSSAVSVLYAVCDDCERTAEELNDAFHDATTQTQRNDIDRRMSHMEDMRDELEGVVDKIDAIDLPSPHEVSSTATPDKRRRR